MVVSLWKKLLRGILDAGDHAQSGIRKFVLCLICADQHIRQKIRGGFFRKGSWIMRLEKVQDALNQKNIKFEYTEEDGCGSLDFMFRGLKFHVWEYEDNGWGAETNIYAAGRSEDIDGDYEEKISQEILSWPDMINN